VVISPPLSAFGLLNQYLGTIANSSERMKAELLQSESPLFDRRFGPGSLAASVQTYLPKFNLYPLLFSENPTLRRNSAVDTLLDNNGLDTVLENNDFILDGFVRVVRVSPIGFFKHKIAYLKGQFGFGSAVNQFEWGVVPNKLRIEAKPVMKNINVVLHQFLVAQTTTFPYQHWFLFAVGLVALVLNLTIVRVGGVTSLFAFSVLYAVPFTVFETGWEWRYLMPCYVANFLAAATVTAGVVERLGSHVRGIRAIQT
jgi:hypothetical protein